MEQNIKNIPQRWIDSLGKAQTKVDAKIELTTPMKKVLSVTTATFLGEVTRHEAEVNVSGRIATRVIYIDENDSFNSQERTTEFTEKLTLRDPSATVSIMPHLHVLESKTNESSNTTVEVTHIVDITLVGVLQSQVRTVENLSGGAQVRHEKLTTSTIGKGITARFEIDDRFELDRACLGVLGVDATAFLKDINVSENKITLKGSVVANILATKTVETSTMYNDYHEFEFSKTIAVAELGIEDMVSGNIQVTNIVMKVENTTKPELNLDVELLFTGFQVAQTTTDVVADAFCFDHHLNMTTATVENAQMLPPHNANIEVEGNMTLPETAPYIAKVLSVAGARVTSVNIIPADHKVTIEGVMSANIVYECEEKHIHHHVVTVPFSSVTRVDSITTTHTVSAAVSLSFCKVRARRGRELLVDARLGIGISATTHTKTELMSDITLGEPKKSDDSAIMIFTVAERETLWDIAKRINIPTEEIVAQNPAAADTLTPGDKLFIYRQTVVNF